MMYCWNPKPKSSTVIKGLFMAEIDHMDAYTGRINEEAPGQPYEKQWWMKYWEVEISQPSEQDRKVYGDRACKVKARFKKNRFTGAIYVFRFNCKPRGNRWNEPGYGWGIWEKL